MYVLVDELYVMLNVLRQIPSEGGCSHGQNASQSDKANEMCTLKHTVPNDICMFIAESVEAGSFSSYLLLPSLEFRDTTIYEPDIRALLGTAPHFC